MKVLVQGRYEILDKGGGDKVQIESTVKELKKLGVKIDIKPYLGVDPKDYDIVHIFQLDWTPETFLYAKKPRQYPAQQILNSRIPIPLPRLLRLEVRWSRQYPRRLVSHS